MVLKYFYIPSIKVFIGTRIPLPQLPRLHWTKVNKAAVIGGWNGSIFHTFQTIFKAKRSHMFRTCRQLVTMNTCIENSSLLIIQRNSKVLSRNKKYLLFLIKGDHFFWRRIKCFFFHILKELFKTFKLLFVRTPYLHFHWDMGVEILGSKNPRIFNFIRNKKLWCQIVDNEVQFPKPFEFLRSDENLLRDGPP